MPGPKPWFKPKDEDAVSKMGGPELIARVAIPVLSVVFGLRWAGGKVGAMHAAARPAATPTVGPIT